MITKLKQIYSDCEQFHLLQAIYSDFPMIISLCNNAVDVTYNYLTMIEAIITKIIEHNQYILNRIQEEIKK